MSEKRRQAEHAFRVYLERGNKALSCLSRGDIDQANELLQRREAAFRNFLALDHSAKKLDEPTDVIEQSWQDLLGSGHAQNLQIKLQLSRAVGDATQRSRNINNSLSVLRKYMSNSRRS